jgi:membrane protein
MSRGRCVQSPHEIPASGWKDIALRVKDRLASDHVTLVAAGVAFYALLAIFPAITALMALAGLILEPEQVTSQIEAFAQLMPEQAARIVVDQAVEVAGSQKSGLGLAFFAGLGFAIFSASKGMSSLIEGLNVVYVEGESRGFFKKLLVTLTLTVLMILGLILGLLAALALPAVLSLLALPPWLETTLALSRWVILAVMAVFGLAILYRYGPARDHAEWKWLTPGAIGACLIWIAASVGFSVYVGNFGSYNETFGSIAGIIILLMWLWISAFIVLLGAEVNAEAEAQAEADTTVDR